MVFSMLQWSQWPRDTEGCLGDSSPWAFFTRHTILWDWRLCGCPKLTSFQNMCVQNITSPSANCRRELGHNDLGLYLHRSVVVPYQGLVVNFFSAFHNPLLEFPARYSILFQVFTHTEPGVSLIILTPMKILQRNLKQTYLIVQEIWKKRKYSCSNFVTVSSLVLELFGSEWDTLYIPCILILSKFYLPTDAQLNCLKNSFKKYIKIDIETAPTCFGIITIIRERTIWSC
jgi:hypothetical protein